MHDPGFQHLLRCHSNRIGRERFALSESETQSNENQWNEENIRKI